MSDNGPQFSSQEFSYSTKVSGIKDIICSPHHPSSKGQVERFVETFKRAMKASFHEELPFNHRLDGFLLDYRTTPHSTTNLSHAELYSWADPCALVLIY